LLEAPYSLVPTLLIPCRDVAEVQEQMVAGRPLVCHVKKPEILEIWIAFLKERARASGLSLVIKTAKPGMVVLRMRRP